VKKLVIVSTKVLGGKGGISSALQGYINGLDELSVSYQLVESHNDEKGMLGSWGSAFWQITKLALKHRSNIVFWYHLGPWLSSSRKFSLALLPSLLGCKTIAHIHSPTFNDYLSKPGKSRFLIKFALKPFNRLVMLTPWWQGLLAKHDIKNASVVSPNPNSAAYCKIAQSYIEQPRLLKENQQTFEILSMARLIEGKGVELVISAIAELPEQYILTVAGDGSLKAQLEAQAKALNIEHRVTFTGWIDGEQKDNLLRSADVFCLPSTYDSFGMVFIEAMAFDLPVIAYGWGPINDVVDSEVGECCNQATETEVKRCLEHVCRDLSVYSGKGPKRVVGKYTPKVVANNVAKLLD
jgi:glycosyltransferase involved in cell wall biosynthesis